MNRKKTLWYIFVFIAEIAIVAGGVWGIKLWLRERDPRWQAAKESIRFRRLYRKWMKIGNWNHSLKLDLMKSNDPMALVFIITVASLDI